jgi:CubicO group peptidase (beta-lactamase class C family)
LAHPGWRTSTPEEQGLNSAKLAEALQAIRKQHIHIDSLLIIRNGSVLLDAYFTPYDGSFPHDMASVTKSVMTTLIGIAVDQGKIKLDQPMVSFSQPYNRQPGCPQRACHRPASGEHGEWF